MESFKEQIIIGYGIFAAFSILMIIMLTVFIPVSENALTELKVVVYLMMPICSIGIISSFHLFVTKATDRETGLEEGKTNDIVKKELELFKKLFLGNTLSKHIKDPSKEYMITTYTIFLIYSTILLFVSLKLLPFITQKGEFFFRYWPC